MDKSIFTHQNDEFLLRCQVAQRSEYSYAKKIARWQTVFTIVFAIISIIASIANLEWVTAISSLLSVCLLVFNKYANKYIQTHKKHAAAIQQYIDATLYSTMLNGEASDWGDLPNKTDLANTVTNLTDVDTSAVKNWYSDYSSSPAEVQIFYCQRENIRWDYTLHKEYCKFQLLVMGISFIVLAITFFVIDPNFIKLICILSWFIPIAEHVFSIYQEIGNNILLLQELDKLGDSLDKKIESGNFRMLKRELIKLQYKIWERRATGYLIPDWFYQKYSKKQQAKEDQMAQVIQNIHKK